MKRGCRNLGKFCGLVADLEKVDQKWKGIGVVVATGVLEGLWYETSDGGAQRDGSWRKHTELSIGMKIGLPARYAELVVKLLVKNKFLDVIEDGFRVHDWLDHAPKFVRDAVKKRDRKQTCGGNDATVTPSLATCGGIDAAVTPSSENVGGKTAPCLSQSLSLSQSQSHSGAASSTPESEGIYAYAFRELHGTGKFPALSEQAVEQGMRCVAGHPAWVGATRERAIDDMAVAASAMPGVIGSPVNWISNNLMRILDGMVLGAQKNKGGAVAPALVGQPRECAPYVPLSEQEG